MTHTIFIDGEAGTTGLEIRERLEARSDLELLLLGDRRRDPEARREALNTADAVILCLPDDAAREAVGLIENPDVRVIDASTAHRTADGWVYGFAEMAPGQRAAIALVRPLISAGLLPADWPVSVNAVSGYSGGGKGMIAEFEDQAAPDYTAVPYRIYAMGLAHKHVPEMQVHGGLSHAPIFAPAVGRYAQGMIVEVPLPLWALPGRPKLADLHGAIFAAYAGERFVEVVSLADAAALKTLAPEGLNGTNTMRLHVFGNDEQARLVALLDNLGKGASGAAVQNMNLMLGLPEDAGL